jgi:hypothetical protein
MKVCGFSIACNAVRFGYPIEASLRSMLPIVDEIILNIGEGDEDTWNLVQSMNEPKIKPFRSWWDFNMRYGGLLLAKQTNLALERCTGDWGLYLQADEVLHERDYAVIRQALEDHLADSSDVLRFRYHHFYGSFQTVQDYPIRWYPRAARAVKLGRGVESWGDAMDFCVRRKGKEFFPKQADVRAYVYHYGWVRPPEVMRAKTDSSERLYYEDDAIERRRAKAVAEIYSDLGNLRYFRGTHPAVMEKAIARQDWSFEPHMDRQPPDWVRHAWVWADHYCRHWLRMFASLGPRLKRMLQE